jgi:hypothetical protein
MGWCSCMSEITKEKLIKEWKTLRVQFFNVLKEDRKKFDKLYSKHQLYCSVVKHFDKSFKEVNQIAEMEIEIILKRGSTSTPR